jgi:type IV pilus assembly protein PilV
MKSKNFKTQVQSNLQRGFSLIEVLISIIVMTFGLLGISGLMMSGVNNSTGSDLASRASQSASEIMDAMRANRENAANYKTALGTKSTSITGTTVADKDRKAWLEAVERLPGGVAEIEIPSGTTNTYRVTIRFSNCIGSLSEEEKKNCVNGTAEKRPIIFTFQI